MRKQLKLPEEFREFGREMRRMEYAFRLAMEHAGGSNDKFWEEVYKKFPFVKGKHTNYNYDENTISYYEGEEVIKDDNQEQIRRTDPNSE